MYAWIVVIIQTSCDNLGNLRKITCNIPQAQIDTIPINNNICTKVVKYSWYVVPQKIEKLNKYVVPQKIEKLNK